MGSHETKVLAGIDIGTLTCRLLIAEVSPAGIVTELFSDRRVLRLGEGCALTHQLSDPAMSRVVETLREWRLVLQRVGAEGEIAVATSAVREAANQQEFLARAKGEAGFDVEVISGQEEARRTMLGIRSGLPPAVEQVLGVDIGGGSTEFILDSSGTSPRLHSMSVGVVRLTEEVLAGDPPEPEQVRKAHEVVRGNADSVKRELGELGGATLVGTAGTITTLAAMAQELRVYQPARIHNYPLSFSQVTHLEEELLPRSTVQRRGMAGLEAGREDVIAAGALMLRVIMETFGFASCLVSDLGLREGIIIDLATRLPPCAGSTAGEGGA